MIIGNWALRIAACLLVLPILLLGCRTAPTPAGTALVVASPAAAQAATPLPIPSVALPTATVTPRAPERPQRLADYPAAIARYLSSVRGDAEQLPSLFAAWQVLSKDGYKLEWGDADGDGVDELLVAMRAFAKFPDAEESRPFPVNIMLLLDGQDAAWQGNLLHPRGEVDSGPYALPRVLAVADVNADGRPEVVFVTQACGAHTCFESVHFVQWDGTGYRSLVAKPPTMSYAEVNLDDRNGDGVSELVMTGGTFGSVGAGLQRARTEVYRWDGKTYTLAETTYAPSDYLYHKVMDGEAALKAGDYSRALAAYEQALTDDKLRLWEGHPDGDAERRHLRAFARYRLAFVRAFQGDRAGLERAVAESQRLDAWHPYAELSQLLLANYTARGGIQQACSAITQYVVSHPQAGEPLAGYGYANQGYAPEDFCSVPAQPPTEPLGTPAASEQGTDFGYVQLADGLRQAGLEFEPAGEAQYPFFSGALSLLKVRLAEPSASPVAASVVVFLYSDTQA